MKSVTQQANATNANNFPGYTGYNPVTSKYVALAYDRDSETTASPVTWAPPSTELRSPPVATPMTATETSPA